MRNIEFRGYVGDEKLFVTVPLNEKKAKLSKKDILKIVGAFEVAAEEKGIKGEVEMFGVSTKEFEEEAKKGNILDKGNGRYAIGERYFWLGWGAHWENIQKAKALHKEMDLKELIKVYQANTNDKHRPNSIRGTYKKVLKDLEQLDEFNKIKVVKIPQCAIDVIEEAKEQKHSLFKATNVNDKSKEFRDWIEAPENQELFARAWIEGYEAEEKRYKVKAKSVDFVNRLAFNTKDRTWFFNSGYELKNQRMTHTRKELEDAGFGEVFTSSLFEVEEVK